MEQKYIWTNHALRRRKERKIAETLITATLTSPDRKISKNSYTTEFQKRIDDRTIAVVIKKTTDDEQIVLSCWANPPFPGTSDFFKDLRFRQMKNAKGIKRLWLRLLYRLAI